MSIKNGSSTQERQNKRSRPYITYLLNGILVLALFAVTVGGLNWLIQSKPAGIPAVSDSPVSHPAEYPPADSSLPAGSDSTVSQLVSQLTGSSEPSTLVSSEPVSSEPVSSEPVSSEPVSSEPVSSTPVSSTPVSSTPASSTPVSSTPVSSTPVSSTPVSSTPVSSTPVSSEPVSSTPVPSTPVPSTPVPSTPVPSTTTMKAVWISYMEVQTFQDSDRNKFIAKVSTCFNDVAARGLNTVIVQVRPHGDACYPSSYYPWSKTVSGTMGTALDYDPLAIMIDLAHARGLSIHAWLNPYRTMTDKELTTVPDSYPIKQWYLSPNRSDYMLKLTQDRWWLKPGNPAVQQLIINGTAEIVQNYAVDGIHIDDYFYAADPAAYGDSAISAKSYTTAMVQGMYRTIKQIKPAVQFGISPLGTFTASNSLPSSDITYYSTDLKLWCQNSGYIDYVMPQIYWDYDHPAQPFSLPFEKWAAFVTSPTVKLYIGLAPYQVPEASIMRQIADIAANPKATGYCLFRYTHLGNMHFN